MPHFALPHGGTVRMEVRPDTNDWNVCYSIITEDEYKLPPVLSGVALDIGAHIGACTAALLELNPTLRVVAVEPIPENIELLRTNTAKYGDRAIIVEGAAGKGPQTIRYGYTGKEEFARVHRFIGNQYMPDDVGYDEITVPGFTLSELVNQYGEISFLKIDCEGCEHAFLDDPAIDQVARLSGEFHAGPRVEIRHEKPERTVKRTDPGEKPANRRKRVTKRVAK